MNQNNSKPTILAMADTRADIDDVFEGRAEYGTADAGLLFSRLQRDPVVVFSQIFRHSPVVLLTLKESGFRTPFDLVDKKIMIDTIGFSDASVNGMLLNDQPFRKDYHEL